MPLFRESVALVLFAAFLSPGPVFAQGSTATLAGSVRDQQSLVVPGATVAISGTENHFARTVATGEDGGFELAGLLPGEYRLQLFANGEFLLERRLHALQLDGEPRPNPESN